MTADIICDKLNLLNSLIRYGENKRASVIISAGPEAFTWAQMGPLTFQLAMFGKHSDQGHILMSIQRYLRVLASPETAIRKSKHRLTNSFLSHILRATNV